MWGKFLSHSGHVMCKFDNNASSLVNATNQNFKFKVVGISLICLILFSLFSYPEKTLMGNWLSGTPNIVNMSGPTAQFVRSAIAKDKVVIFSKSTCPYCSMAKEQFKKLNRSFALYELNQREDGDEIQDVLGEITGARTVPRVFVNGEFIGGGTDVKKLYENGELSKLVS